ncbi:MULTISPECIES: 30S ribosomal protein S12 methylthiotransferase RimO [Psychrilyobacter]|uniref:Ribosomal protein uS12 methylthiotransferase RimO n=1 Tax=Psychrilyobacter piezotolerans TaxID=2293438 RepID=A0ABX9KK36_9FUSO|nr:MULTISPECIES: 30S ribosomal protein S12 methylthiotransferase RimO [Psychrilyobacter]MCS5421415.1 30S ribosomal protein S12 methylthiotransferase RimO [Psychrilyobacter sp. S5]NDI76603.1 30S ribosomal protein S12 methylthiotransferase RimO [Psychrilyobacter piezotolerans]RDE65233.1 30S ribosomal protein S12 methylthiotransferase RimO [Psychrilyobacter sp. S5]REI42851.1 30S ribosomal protein S12 methylthiotransferase RimO [Psychrilyobacter piezotolerans]
MKLAVITLGCSKNLVDTEHYLGILVNKKGFEITTEVEDADLCIINTCGFIGDAKEESIQSILEVAEHKRSGKLKKIIVAGCLAERYADELLAEMPEVDAIIGTGDVDKIEEVIDEILADKRVIRSESLDFLANAQTERIITTFPHTAYLKIAEGCNRRCTYCIIPSLRGNLRSRTIEDIVVEAERLVANGVREINLLAQETTEYGLDLYKKKALPDLMKELAKIEDLKWIRTYYMFPNSVTDELIEVMKTEEKVCNYFDIPIQHVSDSMLQGMKRAISGDASKELLRKIRREIPDATFRTSLIVGFPGETEDDFQELKDFVEEFKFDYIGAFKYSREEDTVAYDMENQVDEDTKHRRWVELTNLQAEIAEAKNRSFLGKEIEVMIDGVSEESEYMLEGRTRGQALEIDGKVLTNDGTAKPGEIVKVKVEQNFNYDLLGPIVANEVN